MQKNVIYLVNSTENSSDCIFLRTSHFSIAIYNQNFAAWMILIVTQKASILMYMIPGSKGLNPHELAHRWVKDLGTRPDMSIKVG